MYLFFQLLVLLVSHNYVLSYIPFDTPIYHLVLYLVFLVLI